jgi:hypothetical protein
MWFVANEVVLNFGITDFMKLVINNETISDIQIKSCEEPLIVAVRYNQVFRGIQY